MRTRVLLVAFAATASLAACGGEDPSSAAADPEAANRKAMLDFTRCMRKNGVDMPDPQFQAGGRVMQRGPAKADPEKMRVAEQACAKYREAVKPREISDEQKEEFRKAALANARCMREHGIEVPDPTFDEDGGAQMRLRRGDGVDPNSAKFQAAQKACASTMPGMGRTQSEEGGEQ